MLITLVSSLALLAAMHLSVHAALSRRFETAAAVSASDLVKILVRHLQQIQLAMEVHALWPDLLLSSTKWISWVLSPGTSVAALECVLRDADSSFLAAARVVFWLVVPLVAFVLLMALQVVERVLRCLFGRRRAVRFGGVIPLIRRTWVVTAMTTVFFFYP